MSALFRCTVGALLLVACGASESKKPALATAGTMNSDAGAGASDDPLALELSAEAEPGSFDDVFSTVIVKRCSGQPGLCHNGQFPPNLASPAVAFYELVHRPSLEKPKRLRVHPGQPEQSVLIDKLRNRDVSTQMPLGAEPLKDSEIELLEAWIEAGALRSPEAEPMAELNLPPREPEVGIFDSTGERLDSQGKVVLSAGDTVELRHSVEDYETADALIPLTGVRLQTEDGSAVQLTPGADDPALGTTTHDASAPAGTGDALNRVFTWTVPTTVTLLSPLGASSMVAPAGLELTLVVFYTDQINLTARPLELGFVRVAIKPNAIGIQ